jgi:predicted O-methyltransferase YrrM
LRGEWQHGWIPPERNVHPEWVVGSTGESRLHRTTRTYFVARQDQVDFLKRCGYTNVEAIGHPLIYLKVSDTARLTNSLLIMPSHSTREGSAGLDEGLFQYLDYIKTIRHRFTHVKACVHQCDLDFYASKFHQIDIDVLEGALEEDQNSYERMAFLGKTFEYMTTNSFGSHVAYLSYFGARVSVSGPKAQINQSKLKDLTFYKNCPACIEHAASLHDILTSNYSFFVSDPWLAQPQVDWSKDQLGETNKLPINRAKSKIRVTPSPTHSLLAIGNKLTKLVNRPILNRHGQSIRSLIRRKINQSKPSNKLIQLALSVTTHLSKDDLFCLMRFANTLPAKAICLEIGSYLGASALATCAGFKSTSIRLYCIDKWMDDTYISNGLDNPSLQTRDTFGLFLKNTRSCKRFLKSIQGCSHEAFSSIADEVQRLDWLFIDGDLSHQEAKQAWQFYNHLLDAGSLIIFHGKINAENLRKLIIEEITDCCILEESLHNMKVFRYISPPTWP